MGRRGRKGKGLVELAASLYREGWTMREIAGLVYGDASRKAQLRAVALIGYARKKGLINIYRRKRNKNDDGDSRPIKLNVWSDHHWVRAPFEMVGSTGPRSYGFLDESERRRLALSAVVADVAGAAGVKEYGIMYVMAQELCSFLARKYDVSKASAVGCVLTAVLALAPENKELIRRVLEWLELF